MTTSKKAAKGTKKSAKSQSKKSASSKVGAASQELGLKIATQGPSPELFATLSREVLQHPSLQPFPAKTRSRLGSDLASSCFELVHLEPTWIRR